MIKESIEWGCNYLLSHGYQLKSSHPENIKDTPWSHVARFSTSDGYIYLKHTPKLIALEADIIRMLHAQFRAGVPIIIAHNTELNCFLMKDAGRPLREILKQQFDTILFCKVVDQFTSLQINVANHIDSFLNIGVPDYRLDKLPDLYMQLLSQRDLLISDGLSEHELGDLKKLHSIVSTLCKKLAGLGIKQTIVQPDFNDNNTLIGNVSKNITFIDLGEMAISHPFFSLLNCLQQIQKHHGLTEKNGAYLQIMDSCLKNFMVFGPRKQLLDAFETARILLNIYGSLCGYRLMIACGKEKIMSYQHGKLATSLKEFMAACIDNRLEH